MNSMHHRESRQPLEALAPFSATSIVTNHHEKQTQRHGRNHHK